MEIQTGRELAKQTRDKWEAAEARAREVRVLANEPNIDLNLVICDPRVTSIISGKPTGELAKERSGGIGIPFVRLAARKVGYTLFDIKAYLKARAGLKIPQTPKERQKGGPSSLPEPRANAPIGELGA